MPETITKKPLKKGSTLELKIEKLAFGGKGVARENGFVLFVDGALPGQTVQARITKKRSGYAEARTVEVVKPSPQEVAPQCRHFGECGGCRFQNFEYQAQVAAKYEQVVESLEHIGAFSKPQVHPPIASPDRFHYRNKMEYSFGRQRWISSAEITSDRVEKPRDFALGLHVRGRYDKILDIDECHLQSERSVEILKFVRQHALSSGLQAYTTEDHSGFWRNLVVREGKHTGQVLVNIVTADVKDGEKAVDALAKSLSGSFPDVTTMVHNINRGKAQTAIGEVERVVFGPGTIQERIGERIYQVSANSFFQTNTLAAELLYRKVLEFADFQGDELVYDLYAGAGTISLFIADRVRQVIGFELVTDAIKDAQLNCGLNEVVNCSFVAGDVRASLYAEKALAEWGRPDVVLIDPPRAGMHADVLKQAGLLAPKKIVYISCNPTTFARDARLLCDSEYTLQQVQPVDMFPMTPHIELVALLTQK